MLGKQIQLGMRKGDRLFAFVMLGPAVILLLLLNVYPFLTAAHSSLYNIHTVTRATTWAGLDNYLAILKQSLFWQSLWRSVVWTGPGVVLQLVLGIAIALLLHQELKGRWFARGMVLFPYLVPAIVASLVWRFMFNPLTGMVNYLLVDVLGLLAEPIAWLADPTMAMVAVIIVGTWKYVPFMVILFLARLQTTPLELYDAARIDGANAWKEFWYITLPWLRPTIIVAILLRTLWMFNHFDMVYLMAFGGPSYATTTLPVLIHTVAFGLQQMGQAAAISMLMVIVLFVVSIVYLHYYQRSEELLRH
ncbi:MAG: sugar ABC transporter permease [Ardenticatenaceae bacterium]|nr:sugar ABC transporter permease [Ardenticatenaceae bacterium]HBY92584.1 sugar ABC transporter permease [Chloroflexota bacterium]